MCGQGVQLGTTIVHTLGYVDDITLIDKGDASSVLRHSLTVTTIVWGSKKVEDMHEHQYSENQINTCVRVRSYLGSY